jgi:hypothetical protein
LEILQEDRALAPVAANLFARGRYLSLIAWPWVEAIEHQPISASGFDLAADVPTVVALDVANQLHRAPPENMIISYT